MNYDNIMLIIMVAGIFIFLMSIFSSVIKIFIVNPLLCAIIGHKFEEAASLDDGDVLMQCSRCYKCKFEKDISNVRG